MEPEKRKVMELGQRFHYSKVQRKQDKLLPQKRKKRNRMMKLYSKGLMACGELPHMTTIQPIRKTQKVGSHKHPITNRMRSSKSMKHLSGGKK